MFFGSSLSTLPSTPSRKLLRSDVAGGGGGGKGGSGGGIGGVGSDGGSGGSKSHGGSRSGGGSSSSGSSSGPSIVAVSPAGKPFWLSSSSKGGFPKSTIPFGKFAGRKIGGGWRAQVYGSAVYGSGYPGYTTRGVSNRGFPFLFYPIVFPRPSGSSSSPYLYCENEYGKVDNTTRPGESLFQLSLAGPNYTIRITSDKFTVISLSTDISPCTTSSGLNVSSPILLNSSAYFHPKPEEALQYYRSSSVVLSLDSFNNNIAFSSDDSAMMYASIPAGVNSTFIQCANKTIGDNVLLPNGSMANSDLSHPLVMILFCLIVLHRLVLDDLIMMV